MVGSKTITHRMILDQLHNLKHDVKAVSDEIADLKAEVLHSRRAEANDTKEIKEKLMVLQGSADRLGAVVQKLVVDGQTVQTTINTLNQKIQDLIDQGSANATELAALKADVAAAVPQIDAHITDLETLDASVQDPSTPLDPNTPV